MAVSDPLTTASWFLANTKTLNLATGISHLATANPALPLAAQRTFSRAIRAFCTGYGGFHKPLSLKGFVGWNTTARRDDAQLSRKMSASIYNGPAPADTPITLIAALGAENVVGTSQRADRWCTSPFYVARAHRNGARDSAVDQNYAWSKKLFSKPTPAKPVSWLDPKDHQKLLNYRNNWLRMGMTEQDIDDLSDRFIDATFAWGSQTP